VYTDDAELLGRRVEDSHTRKAAVELEGLREELARAGLTRTQKETVAAEEAMRPGSVRERATVERTIGRVVRQMRTLRVERVVRGIAQSMPQWLRERLGMTQDARQRQSCGMRV
jgi:hypothetical protein